MFMVSCNFFVSNFLRTTKWAEILNKDNKGGLNLKFNLNSHKIKSFVNNFKLWNWIMFPLICLSRETAVTCHEPLIGCLCTQVLACWCSDTVPYDVLYFVPAIFLPKVFFPLLIYVRWIEKAVQNYFLSQKRVKSTKWQKNTVKNRNWKKCKTHIFWTKELKCF